MIFVVLPTYNEENKIRVVLEGLGEMLAGVVGGYRIILVNDGSTDRTAAVAGGMLDRLPLTIIEHEENRGVHEAFRTGFMAVYAMADNGDIIFTMDADGTHDVKRLPEMIAVINQGYDIVIASRFRPGSKICGVPVYRNLLSYAARYLIPFLFGEREARDVTTFHRAYRAKALKQLVDHFGDRLIETKGFTSNTEVLLKARMHFGKALKVTEVPCELHYEFKQGASKMKVVRNIGAYLSMIWRLKTSRSS